MSYKTYKHELNDSTSLRSNKVLCLLKDIQGRIWIGTETGLNIYNRDLDNFQKINLGSNNTLESIFALEEDPSKALIIGSVQGVFKLNYKDFTVSSVDNALLDGQTAFVINTIKHTQQGKTYVATSLGLKEIDDVNNKLIDTRLLVNDKKLFRTEIKSLFLDSDDNLWLGTAEEGVYKATLTKDSNNSVEALNHLTITSKKIMDFAQLADKSLLVGTENEGLFHLDNEGNKLRHYSLDNSEDAGLLHNSIWSLFVDNNERIWLGYYNSGLAISDRLYDKFLHIKSIKNNDNSLKAGSVKEMVKVKRNELWIATDGGGIDIFNTENNTVSHINSKDSSHYNGLFSDYIGAMLLDSEKNLWVASWDNGLYLLKNGSRHFKNYNKKNTSGNLVTNTILSLAEDANGIIWLGTYLDGIQSLNPKTGKFKKYDLKTFTTAGITNTQVRKVLVDSKDNIWLGTIRGLYRVKQSNTNDYVVDFFGDRMTAKHNNPADVNYILTIYEDSNNDIWIGTRGAGLCKYDISEDEFLWFNKFNGLEEENVSAIIEDDNKNLWVSGNSGITKINLKTSVFTNYTSDDGLLSNDYNFSAVLKDENGYLYFGNIKGVDYFNPNGLEINKQEPLLYLTDFKLFNESVVPNIQDSPLKNVIAETNRITLNHKQSVFTIEYTGVNYTRTEKNQYAYFLQGYENDWNYVGNKRSATYTNLDHGEYVFKLKASNNDGIWNEVPLQLSITVLPAWWKSNLAICIYLLLFFTGIFLLNYLTKARLKEKAILKSERDQRLHEEELNEKKIQFFTNISHEFRTPLTLIINPLKDIINSPDLSLPESIKNKHKIIYKNTDRLYRLINELMDFRKLELDKIRLSAQKIDAVAFTQNVISYFEDEARAKNIYLTFDAEEPNINLWADINMFEKIIFNFLSNAFKVSESGGTINISILSSNRTHVLPLIHNDELVDVIEIRVSDSGPGIPKDQLDKIFNRFYQINHLNNSYYGGTGIGLELVSNFVKLHRGKIEVKSEIGEGTTFTVIFPKGKSHLNANEIIENQHIKPRLDKNLFVSGDFSKDENNDDSKTSGKKKYHLLIVEDNEELVDYLFDEMKGQYNILTAPNGKKGLELARQQLPDVILTDIMMPEMDGHVFAKFVKSDIRTSHIPILMLTAKTRIEDRIQGLEIGADAYMVKPFDIKLLKLRIAQLIKSRQLIFDKYFSDISGAKEKTQAQSIDKKFIENLLNYVNKNISNPDLSVEILSEKLNLSRSQLYRKIKTLTGQTPNEFIRRIRLERAKKLLVNGGVGNVGEVCYKVGFSSPSYFTKCFKAHFKILPTDIETEK